MTPSTDTRPQSRRSSSRLSNSTDRFQPSLNIEDILVEAQHRWLRPAEICEILRNYHKFHIAPEPANKPPSGSLFLFDRKILRYFRKDGHNWRKKKDGKTVKEAHERLKEESVDVLHCYYAHGEDNENFQRRTYWLLEESLMHIVLVHYLELKGSKASFSRARDDNGRTHMQMDSPACSSSFTSQNQLPSQTTDAGSPTSARTAEYEDADSDYCQTRSRYHPFLGMQQYEDGQLMVSSLLTPSVPIPSLNQYEHQTTQAITPESDHYSAPHEDIFEVLGKAGLDLALSEYDRTQLDLKSWVEGLDHTAKGYSNASFQASLETEGAANGDIPTQVTFTFGELLRDELPIKQTDDRKAKLQCANPEVGSYSPLKPNMKSEFSFEGNMIITKQTSLDIPNMGGEDLKKYDSFSKWMSRELGEVEEPNVKSNSQADWNFMETERVENSGMSHPEQLDAYLMGPFVSQDQLFSIVDFSPSWAYSISETKVLVTGKFLKDKDKVENIKLSCMFGELEVPAEILADGILRCYAPPHKSGKVPFYITCSNRLACSEVREFEFRANLSQCMENSGTCNTDEMSLHIRLGRLLSLGSVNHASSISTITDEKIHLSNRISSVLMQDDDRWFNFLKLTNNEEFSPDRVKDELLQKLLKEKLHDWLLQKVAEGGKGPNILDKDGQGVLHLTAALGYDWAIKPTVIAGGNINFRDVNGWTALHWAAYCGRECTVVSLVTLGAFPGALTNPTSEFPSVRTPADLASENGHKGIAGFLAESSLTCHLSCLAIKDTSGIDMADTSDIGCMENLEEIAIPVVDGDMEEGHSLKDSLSAVRNAALAAARIHQAFRVDSFQRKRLAEFGDDQCGMSVEHALSLISVKTSKLGQHDMPIHAAAIKIQNKFRGWKGRKEFLITRQQIVKIQAHVRGHQVRKHYKNCWVWTVGIVEKAILRWRRKGSGLRGFRAEGLLEGTSMQTETAKENEYDFLKEGRNQAEARTEKALSRVKSMVQYPEARDQYCRLLNAASEVQESNLTEDTILNEAEAALGDITIELDEIWEDDAPMPST